MLTKTEIKILIGKGLITHKTTCHPYWIIEDFGRGNTIERKQYCFIVKVKDGGD